MLDELFGQLEYNDEEAGATPLVTVEYSREVLPWLLYLVEILVQEQHWTSDSDFKKVQAELRDLQDRLIGADVSSIWPRGFVPWFIPAISMRFDDDCNPTDYIASGGLLCNQSVYTDGVNTEMNLCHFWGTVDEGSYKIEVWHSKYSMYGKFELWDQIADESLGIVDCYAASASHNNKASFDLDVGENKLVSVKVIRRYKNASSSACQLMFQGFGLRNLHGDD